MKQRTYSILTGFFFLLLLLPTLLLPFHRNLPTENRPLAQVPVLIQEGGINTAFPEGMELFFQDHFAGRTQMITLYSRLIAGLFGQSANEKVILGKEGWLFFQETLPDYEGSGGLSPEELEQIVSNLSAISAYLHARGKEFIMVIPPNKNTLYGTYMPDRYQKSREESNYDRLVQRTDLPILDLRPILLSAPKQSYYRSDTHWNAYGARLAVNALLTEIQEKTRLEIPSFSMGLTPRPVRITGDLSQMLYPAWTPQEEDGEYPDTARQFQTRGSFRSPEEPQITTDKEGGVPLSLYVLRDSFCNALLPYLSNTFQQVHYTRQMPISLDSPYAEAADVVILEITERRLSELLLPPVFPSL